LLADVAGDNTSPRHERIEQYLRGRTAFFDRVVVNALGREVGQVVNIGAGYDGRSLRYAKDGVRWFEVDHPDTQRDKRERLARLGIEAPSVTFARHDLTTPGLASTLVRSGYDPDGPSLILCEGVAAYLSEAELALVLGELRALATVGTRLAWSWTPAGTDPAWRQGLASVLASWGEPLRGAVTAEEGAALLEGARWRMVKVSERAQRTGFVVAAPQWMPATVGAPPTAGRIGAYMERMYHRSGIDRLPGHLERHYGIRVAKMGELDVGVMRVDRVDGPSWVARVFPVARPLEATYGDAEILRILVAEGFPAERLAHAEAVSVHQGQAVLVTEFVAGRRPPQGSVTFERLGDLLGRLHTLQGVGEAGGGMRPGGAWHHMALEGGPRDEIAANLALLDAAAARVPAGHDDLYQAVVTAVGEADDLGDLPQALIHPDLVPVNVIAAPSGAPGSGLTVVDWAGAGWGPRLFSLGVLLWAAGDAASVDAVAAGYRRHVRLEPAELGRLEAAIGLRAWMFAAWDFATGRRGLHGVVDDLAVERARAARWAARAVAALG
jgi:methyltransferase (TIGR00027 family)